MASGSLAPDNSSAMTPSRVTRVEFDTPEYVLSQSFWSGVRMFNRVSSIAAQEKGGDSALSTNVFPWSSGVWTLRPRQWDTGKFANSATGSILTPTSGLTTVPYTAGPLTSTGDNDPFWRKKETGSTWSAALSPPARVTSLSAALSATAGLTPIAKSTSSQAVNQGFCLRFTVDGVTSGSYEWIGAFIFGQYAIGLRGNGVAEIWEYGTPSGGSPVWRRHHSLRYARANQVTQANHHLLIYPHVGPTGEKYISFSSVAMDTTESQGGLASTPGGAGTTGNSERLFRWEETRTDLPDSSGGSSNVTTAGQIWLLERPAIRGHWQVSKLIFETSGSLTSEFWASPSGDTRGVAMEYVRTLPASTTLTPEYRDQSGAVVVSPGSAFYVKWDMTGPGTTTPQLWGYRLRRDAQTLLVNPTSFTMPGTNYQITGGGADPRAEQAVFDCEDRFDQYPRLHTRGELPVKVYVTDSSGVSPVTVNLFRGYALSPYRTKFGKPNRRAGMGGWGAPVAAPDAEWSQYKVVAAGMWHRLQEVTMRSALSLQYFSMDTTSTTLQPWKVTDAIKTLLSAAGFPASMQNIPDLTLRLYPGIGTQESDRVLDPHTSIAEMIVRLCRNYLGRFLVFDPNQGTHGKWTLVGPPTSTTALAAFVGGPTWAEGDPILPPACLASYPAGTAPTFGKRESYYIPPENNHLWAFSLVDSYNTGGFRVDNHLYNYMSYQVPGSSVTPDPDSPHYIGRERVVIVADPSLWAGLQIGGWDATQKAVDFLLMRLFTFTCMPRQRLRFQAPLLFVTDPSTSARRPLRFYDVVTLDGETGWYVRSCTPNYQFDRQQVADYELERLVPYQP